MPATVFRVPCTKFQGMQISHSIPPSLIQYLAAEAFVSTPHTIHLPPQSQREESITGTTTTHRPLKTLAKRLHRLRNPFYPGYRASSSLSDRWPGDGPSCLKGMLSICYLSITTNLLQQKTRITYESQSPTLQRTSHYRAPTTTCLPKLPPPTTSPLPPLHP